MSRSLWRTVDRTFHAICRSGPSLSMISSSQTFVVWNVRSNTSRPRVLIACLLTPSLCELARLVVDLGRLADLLERLRDFALVDVPFRGICERDDADQVIAVTANGQATHLFARHDLQ